MNRDALKAFRQTGQAKREELRGVMVRINLDAERTSPRIMAGVKKDPMGWKQNDQTGQLFRQQTAYAHIDLALLPEWATEDALPLIAKIEIDDKWFKIASAEKQGVTMRITANRWPDDSD